MRAEREVWEGFEARGMGSTKAPRPEHGPRTEVGGTEELSGRVAVCPCHGHR